MVRDSDESEFPQLDAAEREFLVNQPTTMIPVPPKVAPPNREDIRYLLNQKFEDLELWLAFREKYGHINLLISSINSDRLLLGESDKSIPEIPWGEF